MIKKIKIFLFVISLFFLGIVFVQAGTITTQITVDINSVPTVAQPTVTSITQTSATINTNVTSLGIPASISARGTCINAETSVCEPTTGTTTGAYSVTRTGLTCGKEYYAYGYATNTTGTGYSTATLFTTAACDTVPTVTTTSPITSITQTTATGGGNVTSNGGATVTVSGIVWHVSTPTTSLYTGKTTNGWAIGGPWTSGMTGLACGTTYHVRAYATNSVGTAYGADITFTTAPCSCLGTPWGTMTSGTSNTAYSDASPTASTTCAAVSQTRTCTNGVLSGTYTNISCVQGCPASAGFGNYGNGDTVTGYLSSAPISPTICSSAIRTCTGGSVSSFGSLNNTSYSATSCAQYYVASFNSNGGTPSYPSVNYPAGATVASPGSPTRTGYTFTGWSPALPSAMPAVNTTYTAQWSANSCSSPCGTIASGATCTAWSTATATYPTLCASQIRTCTTGTLSGTYTNVECIQLYVIPTVTTTSPVTSIAQTTATGGGNVTSNGGATVTVSGIVWHVSTPTTSLYTGKTTNGWAIGGPWTSGMTGLTANTTYHVRAYATNSVGTAYGADVIFTTPPANCTGTPWGTMTSGTSNTAYSDASPTASTTCAAVSQTRTCTNGVLSGTYTNISCVQGCPASAGFGNYGNGDTVTGYLSSAPVSPTICSSATRTCTGGAVSAFGSLNNTSYSATICTQNYVASFNSNGGTPSYPSVNYPAGATVASPGSPTRTGYTFTGWSPALPSAMPATNTTFTAQWNILTYTITASTGTGGNVTPAGVTSKTYGSSQTYTITPSSTRYSINSVLVDGSSVGAVSSYTFSNIVATHTISATFNLMTGNLTASNCSIALNGTACNTNLIWSTTNPIGTSAVTTPTSITVASANSSAGTAYSVGYGTRTFYLYNNGNELKNATATASCVTGTSWDGGKCAPITITFTSASSDIAYNTATTLNWSVSNATSCTASGGWSGAKATSGSASTGNLTALTSFTLSCTGLNGTTGTASLSVAVGSAGDLTASNCTILPAQNKCDTNLVWNTYNPLATSAVTTNPGITVATANSNAGTAYSVDRGSRDFYLYNNGVLLATATATASCEQFWDSTTSTCAVVPTLTTPTSSIIFALSAKVGATITSLGIPASISERGVCYSSTMQNPSIENNGNGAICGKDGNNTNDGTYTIHLVKILSPNTTYYYRGYATNIAGTGYSPQGSFTTLVLPDKASVIEFKEVINKTKIEFGEAITLIWNSTDAYYGCAMTSNFAPNINIISSLEPNTRSGSISLKPTKTTVYSLVCDGEGGNSGLNNPANKVQITVGKINPTYNEY